MNRLRVSAFVSTYLVFYVPSSSYYCLFQDSETHFKVVVVSQSFSGQPLLARHRAIQACLQSELDNGVHALSIVAKTPEQWAKTSEVKPSPTCVGGFGK